MNIKRYCVEVSFKEQPPYFSKAENALQWLTVKVDDNISYLFLEIDLKTVKSSIIQDIIEMSKREVIMGNSIYYVEDMEKYFNLLFINKDYIPLLRAWNNSLNFSFIKEYDIKDLRKYLK